MKNSSVDFYSSSVNDIKIGSMIHRKHLEHWPLQRSICTLGGGVVEEGRGGVELKGKGGGKKSLRNVAVHH